MIDIGEKETAFLRKHIDAKSWNGIDVGCGGRKTIPQCIGIDTARDEMTDASCGQNTLAEWVCDGTTLPFLDSSVDYVLSRHVLEHMEWKTALTEWIRVLKTHTGILSIVVPDPNCSHHPGHGLDKQEVSEFCITLGMTLIDDEAVLYSTEEPYSWGITLQKC